MEDEPRQVCYARTSRRGSFSKICLGDGRCHLPRNSQRLQFRLGILRSPALQPLVENNRAWWIAPPSNTVPEFMMVPTGLHLPYFHPAASFATHYHMSSSITVESLDLGEALVHEEEALATYRRLAEEAGLSERIATLLVSNMGYRTLEDLENVSGAQVEDKSIQAIIDLDIPLVTCSRLEKLIKAIRGAAEVSLDQGGKEQWGMRMVPYHQRSRSAWNLSFSAGTSYASQQMRTQEKQW